MIIRLMSIALCICFVVLPGALVAEGYYIQWADSIDNYADWPRGVAVDSANNIIVTGYSNISTNYDFFTVKYDFNGVLLWADTIDNGYDDFALDVTVDRTNSIIVTGVIWNGTNYDYFTVKYDSTGGVLWTDTIDNGNDDHAYGVAVDNYNNIIVTGHSWISSNYDYFTVKYDANGVVLWADTIDNGGDDIAFDAEVDNYNNIIVTGQSRISGDDDYYTVKYDSTGTILWADTLHVSGGNVAKHIAVDNVNNIIVTGYVVGDSNYDYCTVKYDPDGTVLWVDTIDNSDRDYAYGVAVDNDNNVIVTGHSQLVLADDFYTVKYDPNGVILWADTIDNGDEDQARAVAVDNANNIIVTGNIHILPDRDFYTVKYGHFDSLVIFTPNPDSLNPNSVDSTMVQVAIYNLNNKLSGLSDTINFYAHLGTFYGDVHEDISDTTYYQWYRAGDTVGADTIWGHFCTDSAMTIIFLVPDTLGPLIAWWDSLPNDTSSVPQDTLFGPYQVRAELLDRSGVSSVWIYWNTDSVEMYVVSGDTFIGEISEQVVHVGDSLVIGYYIKAWDASPDTNLTQSNIRSFTIYHYESPGVEEFDKMQDFFSFRLEKNPAKNRALFFIALPEVALVRLQIYDAVGRLVDTPASGVKSAGYYRIAWGTEKTAGVYYYKFESPWGTKTGKFVLVR